LARLAAGTLVSLCSIAVTLLALISLLTLVLVPLLISLLVPLLTAAALTWIAIRVCHHEAPLTFRDSRWRPTIGGCRLSTVVMRVPRALWLHLMM
jgi:hypothetical protein